MSEGIAVSRSSGWMVSPSWDMAFIVASPVAIIPGLWILAYWAMTPEQLALPVFAFATLGHHLPGYMRAYGDRELFARFRLRFVVVPPVLFGFVLLLVQPSLFGLEMRPPSSLQLLIVVWGAWHGLMQIYGFMRIYDAKQGRGHGRTQQLDLALCFAIFAAGFLFSDARMFGLMDLVWQTGFPTFDASGLATARHLGAAGLAALAVVYLTNMLGERRRGRRMGGVKLTLALGTGGLYTFSGLVTTDMLLGAAIFEVFHAVQYLAIVWYFNRRLEARKGDGFGPLRFLFRDRWSSLCLYLVSVAAFGAIFLAVGTPEYGPIAAGDATTGAVYALFSAFFVTSSLLHYYYDGFIWKLHDRNTGRTLGSTRAGLSEVSVPAILHLCKWGGLATIVLVLSGLEVSKPATAERYAARLRALATITPDVPELGSRLVVNAIEEGRPTDALEIAQNDVALRTRSHTAHAELGLVHASLENWEAAEAAYRSAVRLNPKANAYRIDVARMIARQGGAHLDEAIDAYRLALAHDPSDRALLLELAAVERARGEPGKAAALVAGALTSTPDDDMELRLLLVELLLADDRPARAAQAALEGTNLAPESAAMQRALATALIEDGEVNRGIEALTRAHGLDAGLPGIDFQLGHALFEAQRLARAEPHLLHAAKQPNTPGRVYFMLGTIFYKKGQQPGADAAWQRFIAGAPDPATGQRTLARLLLEHNEREAAAQAYRASLALEPNHALTRYRLGKLLWEAQDREEGARQLRAASRLGQPLPPRLQVAISRYE
jgi:tetratricopeptide (TPR) repeat protein